MDVVDSINRWIDVVLHWAAIALAAWALIDCATRKAKAFPAAGKLTKIAWLAILAVLGVLGYFYGYDPVSNILGSVMVVAALVYLCDVRPAVREISGGR